jgi:hypothetical protein
MTIAMDIHKQLDEFYVFCEIFDDDFDMMAKAAIDLCGLCAHPGAAAIKFRKHLHHAYPDSVSSVLVMDAKSVFAWKRKYLSSHQTLPLVYEE